MHKSLANNAILNILKNSLNILFPLISFPYISRILGPDNVGEVNYVLSITAYFTLISTFGIPIYGTRELAKVRDDKDKFEKVTNELFIISLISTIITYIIYLVIIVCVPQFNEFRLFFLVAGFLIIFNSIGIEWLYQAVEDFFLITLRSVIIKILSLILLFSFVRTGDDKLIYLCIIVFATVGSNVFNLIYSKNYTKLNIFNLKKLNIVKHIKPLLILLGSSIVANIYLGMDVFILGTITKDFKLVGLYYAAISINRIAITILTSVSLVIIPRVSYYIKSGETKKYKELLQRVFDINIQFSLPIVLFLIICAKEIVFIISGPEYNGAILTMQLITPMILTAAITNILYNQVLIPQNKENIIFLASILGALTCIILNFLLVPLYNQNGTAIATLITEIVVMGVELILVFNIVKGYFFSRSQRNSLISSIGMMIILLFIKYTINNSVMVISTSLVFGFITYFGGLILLKDHNIKYFINRFLWKRNSQ